jgi:hypothetical protein
MPLTLTANPSLTKSFRTALLLTGNMSHAEDAVLEAIQVLDSDQMSDDALFRATILAAVMPGREAPTEMRDPGVLPPELMRVLHLPTHLRHCFVLRILAAFPEADCARILNLSIPIVDERTCQAVRRLSGSPVESRCLAKPYNPFALFAERPKVVRQDYATS